MSHVATAADRAHLRRALEIADRGRGRVSPNPLVGAVVTRTDGEVLGEGWHAALGEAHAEVAALVDCRRRGGDPNGGTLYVTLEPCAHHGRQPPCTDAILAAGLARVVVGCEDPTEKASGRGPGILRDEGIEVEFAAGAEARAARLLNQPFLKHARSGRPAVAYKAATSLDGRTASSSGDSRWISGTDSRALVHAWRAEADAVAVGIGTALADDPLLTARGPAEPQPRQPTRVVFDSQARLPLESKLVGSIAEAPLVVVHGPDAPAGRVAALRAAGAGTAAVDGSGPARVEAALDELGRRGITSLQLEGGAELAGSFLAAGEIDELRIFIAPILLGDGRPLIEGPALEEVAAATRPLEVDWARSGDDLLVRARLQEW